MVYNVLHLISSAEGGMFRHLSTLTRGLDRNQFNPMVAAAKSNPWLQDLAGEGVPVFPLDFSLTAGWRTVWKLRTFLRMEQIQILHLHSARAALLGRIAAKLAQTPITIYTVHNFPISLPAVTACIERQLAGHTTCHIAVSKALADQLSQWGVNASQIVTIYNGVPEPRYQSPVPKEGPPTIGVVGRLVHLKGIDLFLQAAAGVLEKFPEALFYVIGDGPERPRLEKMAAQLGLGRSLSFVGYQENLSMWWDQLHLLVCCSRQEGLGMSIIEAMAEGIPVVATAVGGIPEIIVPGKVGLLVPPENPVALTNAITTLLQQPQLATAMGQTGQSLVRHQFSQLQMIKRVEELYGQLLQEEKYRP